MDNTPSLFGESESLENNITTPGQVLREELEDDEEYDRESSYNGGNSFDLF